MCNFKSLIVLKPAAEGARPDILHLVGVDSHSELESHFKLRERSSASGQDQFYAKIEYTPNWSDPADRANWTLRLDEERTPAWWTDEVRAQVDDACWRIVQSMIVTDDRELGEGDWITVGTAKPTIELDGRQIARVWCSSASAPTVDSRGSSTVTVESWGSSTVTVESWDSSTVNVESRGSSTVTVESWDSSTVNVASCGSSTVTVESWDSSTVNVASWGSSTATVKSCGSSTATVKSCGSSTVTVASWGSSTANVTSWDSSTANVTSWGSSTAKASGATDDAMWCWRWFDSAANRWRVNVAYVGENGIKKNVKYRLKDGVFVEADKTGANP